MIEADNDFGVRATKRINLLACKGEVDELHRRGLTGGSCAIYIRFRYAVDRLATNAQEHRFFDATKCRKNSVSLRGCESRMAVMSAAWFVEFRQRLPWLLHVD